MNLKSKRRKVSIFPRAIAPQRRKIYGKGKKDHATDNAAIANSGTAR